MYMHTQFHHGMLGIALVRRYLDTCHAWKAERQGVFTLVCLFGFVHLAPATPGFCDAQHVDTLQVL